MGFNVHCPRFEITPAIKQKTKVSNLWNILKNSKLIPTNTHTIQRVIKICKKYSCRLAKWWSKRIMSLDELCQLILKNFKTSESIGINNEVEINSTIQTKRLNSEIANISSKKTISRCSTDVKVKGVMTKKFLFKVN